MGKPRKTLRNLRGQRLFEAWLGEPDFNSSFTEYVRLANLGRIRGLEPEGFVAPGSDTVTGEQREAS